MEAWPSRPIEDCEPPLPALSRAIDAGKCAQALDPIFRITLHVTPADSFLVLAQDRKRPAAPAMPLPFRRTPCRDGSPFRARFRPVRSRLLSACPVTPLPWRLLLQSPSASRQSKRTDNPGCGGSFIVMSTFSVKVVINQVDIGCIGASEPEDDPPVSRHADRPEPLQLPFQRMQFPSRQIHLW